MAATPEGIREAALASGFDGCGIRWEGSNVTRPQPAGG
jgi:hypothetical protein